MKIKSVEATWLRVPIAEALQHVSDLGRTTSFDTALVRVETECGIVGHGEAKEEVGSVANCHAVTAAINHKFGPMLIGGRRAARMPPHASGGWAGADNIGMSCSGIAKYTKIVQAVGVKAE